MEQGLTQRILSAVQRLEGGTASKLPYSTNLSDPARPAVQPELDERGFIKPQADWTAGFEDLLTAGEDVVMQLLNFGPGRVREDYSLREKIGDTGEIFSNFFRRDREAGEYETVYPEATTGERFLAGLPGDPTDLARLAANSDAVINVAQGLAQRAAEIAALPWLRLTSRYLPETADVIRQGAQNAGTLDPLENAKTMFETLSREGVDSARVSYRWNNIGEGGQFVVLDKKTGSSIAGSVTNDNNGVPEIHIDALHNPMSRPFRADQLAKGAAMAAPAMNAVLEIADAAGIRVTTLPSAFGEQTMPTRQLREMYNKLGFQWLPNSRGGATIVMTRMPMPLDDAARRAERDARISPDASQMDYGPAGEAPTIRLFETREQSVSNPDTSADDRAFLAEEREREFQREFDALNSDIDRPVDDTEVVSQIASPSSEMFGDLSTAEGIANYRIEEQRRFEETMRRMSEAMLNYDLTMERIRSMERSRSGN